MGRFGAALLPVVFGVSVLGYAAGAMGQQAGGNEEELRKRVEELEQKVKSLEQILERVEQKTTTAAPQPIPAPQPSPAEQALKQQVEDLDQQVRILGRKQEIEQENAAARAKETPVVSMNQDGFSVRSADNAFRFRLGALLQADARFFFDQPPLSQPDQFLLRRVRPILEGTFYEKYSFRIMPDFAGGQAQLFDAYVDANLNPALRIRVGKFKPPVGLERLESAADLAFVERGFPTNLVPTRDIGAQLSGDLLGGTLYYAAGVFDGAVDGGSTDGDNNNAKDFNARLFAHPFKNSSTEALRGLGLGFAYTTGNQLGTTTSGNLPQYRTPGQQVFFTYAAGVFADGGRERYAPQFYYYNGPLGMMGEYYVSAQEVTRLTNHRRVSNSAWQIYATWVVTGEDASYRGVKPRVPFDWGKRTWGAFEVAARVSGLDVDDDAFLGSASTRLADPSVSASEALDLGIGLNWYLNPNLKIVLGYDQTSFDGGAPNGGDREDEKVLFTRFQVAY